MKHSKIDPLQADDWPSSLRDQVLKFNKLLVQDEYHRNSDLSNEERIKWLDARASLLNAQAALYDARVDHYTKSAKKEKNEFWRAVAKAVLSVGASLAYLIYQLVNLGWGIPAIAALVVSMTLVCVTLIYWISN